MSKKPEAVDIKGVRLVCREEPDHPVVLIRRRLSIGLGSTNQLAFLYASDVVEMRRYLAEIEAWLNDIAGERK